MKISKDLMDAMIMVFFITFVLILTSDFENVAMKNILMGVCGVIVAIAICGRVMEAKNNKEIEE